MDKPFLLLVVHGNVYRVSVGCHPELRHPELRSDYWAFEVVQDVGNGTSYFRCPRDERYDSPTDAAAAGVAWLLQRIAPPLVVQEETDDGD